MKYNQGWILIKLQGDAKRRGYEYGKRCAEEFSKIQKMLNFFVFQETGKTWKQLIDVSNKMVKPVIIRDFHEFYTEMFWIAKGCCKKGTQTNVEEIIAWNNYFLLIDLFRKSAKEHCSAFICNGDYTKDGRIVVAHNSFSTYIDGQYGRVILKCIPEQGNQFIMITTACWIWSGADFFVTSQGIVGTETTIAFFNKTFQPNHYPICCRIRQAMQYGTTLDDYLKILTFKNGGDYANSWLFGCIKTNEIMRIELGLRHINVERSFNGFYIGFNSTYDKQLRKFECSKDEFYNLKSNIGSRRVRLTKLLNAKGIDCFKAKKIISDHYDSFTKKVLLGNRGICSHSEYDVEQKFEPKGAVDATVADAAMIEKMSFWARYGSSCGKSFSCKRFFKLHPEWGYLKEYLFDRRKNKWIIVTI